MKQIFGQGHENLMATPWQTTWKASFTHCPACGHRHQHSRLPCQVHVCAGCRMWGQGLGILVLRWSRDRGP